MLKVSYKLNLYKNILKALQACFSVLILVKEVINLFLKLSFDEKFCLCLVHFSCFFN